MATATKQAIDEQDAKVLKYSGMMGHEFNVTTKDVNGTRRVVVECNTVSDALRHAEEYAEGRVYQKTKSGWRLVRPVGFLGK